MAHSILRPIPGLAGITFRQPSLRHFFLFLAILTLAGIFHVWSRSALIQLNYDISRHETRLRELQREESCLRVEVASLKSLSRIERVAVAELQLRAPVASQVVIVR